MSPRSRRWLAFAFALAAAVAGESLLIVRVQITSFEKLSREDFRTVFFLKAEPSESRRQVLEEKLLGLPEVASVRFIPRDEALAALRQEDPELADSVAWMGENPLPSAFEVRPSPVALEHFGPWLESVRGAADWSDVRYRPAQVQSILQAALYGHFLGLVLSFLLCITATILGVGIWRAPASFFARSTVSNALLPAAGAAAGLLLALAAAWPARPYLPWWHVPPAVDQIILVASAALAASAISLWPVSD
jgi:hypothetical protein